MVFRVLSLIGVMKTNSVRMRLGIWNSVENLNLFTVKFYKQKQYWMPFMFYFLSHFDGHIVVEG